MPDPQLLRMKRIDFVGFVDEGANQEDGEGAYIKVWKNADGPTDVTKDMPAGVQAILKAQRDEADRAADHVGEPGEAWAEIETIAKKLLDAGTAPTKAQAIEKALVADPALYDRYVAGCRNG